MEVASPCFPLDVTRMQYLGDIGVPCNEEGKERKNTLHLPSGRDFSVEILIVGLNVTTLGNIWIKGSKKLHNCWTKLNFGFSARHTQLVKPWPLASLRRVHIEHSERENFLEDQRLVGSPENSTRMPNTSGRRVVC